MPPPTRSDARLNFRLPGELKRLIEQAAVKRGQSVSEYAVSTLVSNAHEVIRQDELTELSRRDRDRFIALLDDADAEPNEALKAAAQRYVEQLG